MNYLCVSSKMLNRWNKYFSSSVTDLRSQWEIGTGRPLLVVGDGGCSRAGVAADPTTCATTRLRTLAFAALIGWSLSFCENKICIQYRNSPKFDEKFRLKKKSNLYVPGGATIRCHFWNSVVLRQSRGLRAYALCRDINSCIGSSMTHNWNNNQQVNRRFDYWPPTKWLTRK